MKQEFRIYNHQDRVVIDIEGTIGVPEEWQFEEPQQRVATYEKFRKMLQQIESLECREVVVNIRSTGGDVNDALLIYDALSSLDASITTRCWGYVASAATVIAQAASVGQREISPNALYLIHSATSAVEGNAQELEQRIALLRKTDERLAELYAVRSGGVREIYSALMGEECGAGRWLNASETIEMGLADRMVESAEKEPTLFEEAVSAVKSVARRIGIGGVELEANVSRHSVTHDVEEMDTSLQRSLIAFGEGQRSISKSAIREKEDPVLADIRRSGNSSAYDSDVRRMMS